MSMPNIQEWIRKIKAKLDKKTKLSLYVLALILCLVAVVLTSVGSFSNERSDTTGKANESIDDPGLNEQLTELLSNIKGAGRVKVMITYEATDENVYAKDTDEEFENSENRPTQQKIKSEYIIVKGSDGEEGLKIKNVFPTIRGVAVVCDGGNDPNVKGQIVSAVSALFDINSTKISVAEMAQ